MERKILLGITVVVVKILKRRQKVCRGWYFLQLFGIIDPVLFHINNSAPCGFICCLEFSDQKYWSCFSFVNINSCEHPQHWQSVFGVVSKIDHFDVQIWEAGAVSEKKWICRPSIKEPDKNLHSHSWERSYIARLSIKIWKPVWFHACHTARI